MLKAKRWLLSRDVTYYSERFIPSVKNTANQNTRGYSAPDLSIMPRTYAALIVLFTVFSMVWYEIVMEHFLGDDP